MDIIINVLLRRSDTTPFRIYISFNDQYLPNTLPILFNKYSLTICVWHGAIKELFREFDRKPFLYDVNTPDFRAFVTKLSEQDMEEIKFESIAFFREICRVSQLKPKIDEAKACAILSALLSTIATKQTLSAMCDYLEVFDFMIDNLVAEMFE